MSGYLNDPERTAHTVVDGWFRAGDLAWMDGEGYLLLSGRSSDMIIRGGENVYPVEIESVLADHPAVRAVAVVGLPDPHWGEIVAAAVEVVGEGQVSAEELQALCRSRLAAYKVPAVVEVVSSMPRNVNGKVQKHLLVEQLRGERQPGEG
jgi:acyl-CoA synthetase (AMP-forming)/AMP-acid ligase II